MYMLWMTKDGDNLVCCTSPTIEQKLLASGYWVASHNEIDRYLEKTGLEILN